MLKLVLTVLALSVPSFSQERGERRPPHRDVPEQGIPEMLGRGLRSVERFLEERVPDVWKALDEAEQRWPGFQRRFERAVAPVVEMLERDPSARDTAARQVRAQFELQKILAQYKLADEAERGRLKSKLEGALNELFDAKVAAQELGVKRASQQLEQQRRQLEKRKKSKDKIVKQRLEELTGESEADFEW